MTQTRQLKLCLYSLFLVVMRVFVLRCNGKRSSNVLTAHCPKLDPRSLSLSEHRLMDFLQLTGTFEDEWKQ